MCLNIGMIEVVLIFLFLFSSKYLNFPGLFFWGFFLLLVFIAPGFYSLLTGAPFIVSGKKRVEGILALASAGAKDRVVELGCGDARIIRKMWFAGVRDVTGYEFSLPTYMWARFLKWRNGSGEKIVFGDFWKVDYSEVDLLVCFLLDGSMKRFKKRIWGELKKGARVVSNEFEIPGLEPDDKRGRVYLYIKK